MVGNRHTFGRRINGFTIVELLIVIVVIAVLAVITIVAYNGIQQRAHSSAASAAATQAVRKLGLYLVDNGTYPTQLSTIGINDGTTTYQYSVNNSVNPPTYCVTATDGNQSSYVSSTQSNPVSGACPGHGSGGVAAITNLATNPSVETNTTSLNANWGTSGAGTAVRMTDGGQSGNAYFRMTWSTAPTVTWGGVDFMNIPVSTGSSYSASIWVRSSTAQQIRLNLRANTYPTNPDANGTIVNISPNTWTRLTVTASSVPSGVATLRPFTSRSGAGSYQPGDVLDHDALIVVEGSSVPNFADGNTANWIWNGTTNNSTSTGPPL